MAGPSMKPVELQELAGSSMKPVHLEEMAGPSMNPVELEELDPMGDVDKQRLKWETINEDQQVWDALCGMPSMSSESESLISIFSFRCLCFIPIKLCTVMSFIVFVCILKLPCCRFAC
jgi:hypothetical protein